MLLAAMTTSLVSAAPLSPTAWVNGLNMPWENCGNDWGVSYDHQRFNTYLKKYKSGGANVVRQWIHFDGNK